MKFDLCIGAGEVFLEFKNEEDRDLVFENISKIHGWLPEYSEKKGFGKHSARFQIDIFTNKIPISYRWHCLFDC